MSDDNLWFVGAADGQAKRQALKRQRRARKSLGIMRMERAGCSGTARIFPLEAKGFGMSDFECDHRADGIGAAALKADQAVLQKTLTDAEAASKSEIQDTRE